MTVSLYNERMNKRYLLSSFRIIIMILAMATMFSSNVFADMGPKPSITIKVDNISTTDYLVDLFVNAPEDYGEEMDCNCDATQEQVKKLYDLNYDGWISESARWGAFLLMSDINGNSDYTNRFSYFGVPDEYRVVIVNNSTGETRISDIFTRQNFDEYVSINYEDMNAMVGRGDIGRPLISALMTIALTVVAELVVAMLMKIKRWPVIVIVNIITNAVLQMAFFVIPLNYWVIFGVGEVVVFLAESIIYCALMKDEDRKKVVSYTFVANLASALLTFLVYRLF